eukprot:CFRG3107T1
MKRQYSRGDHSTKKTSTTELQRGGKINDLDMKTSYRSGKRDREGDRDRDGDGDRDRDKEIKREKDSAYTRRDKRERKSWDTDVGGRRVADRVRDESGVRSTSSRWKHEHYDKYSGKNKLHDDMQAHSDEQIGTNMSSTANAKSSRASDLSNSDSNADVSAIARGLEGMRDELDHAVFSHGDSFIKINTKQHEDFWLFVRKIAGMKSRRPNTLLRKKTSPTYDHVDTGIPKRTAIKRFNLPSDYSARYRINCSVLLPPRRQIMDDMKISEDTYEAFVSQIHQYAHFLQTQSFRRLATLRKSQSSLPIAEFKDSITESLRSNQVVVLAGDTGCGKSTQVPSYLLKAGFTDIAVTEPRRLACISLAKRVSYETLNAFGEGEIAYQIRFEGTRTKRTKVVFLTEGLLLRQIVSDPALSNYKVVVMDEVHERNINCDFLLGVMKSLLYSRPDLKFVIMSATINVTLFSKYFDNAPIVQVPGRLHPIEVHYLPTQDSNTQTTDRLDATPYVRVLQMIDMNYPQSDRGDVLVFLSGKAEIQTIAEALNTYAKKAKRWIILTLHSALDHSQQDKVFNIAPEGVRKCILSTNIAETSVTIDGIRFVVDSGKVKEMGHDEQTKMNRLQERWISRASAEQRKGRAGRTGPGICYRLYSHDDYAQFEDYTLPEILRVPLEYIILQMKALADVDVDPRRFDFVERPTDKAIETALLNLVDHGALSLRSERITVLGRVLARLPIDVSLGKMLIMSSAFQVCDVVLTIAALFSVQSPFSNIQPGSSELYDLRHEFDQVRGDPFTLFAAYDAWLEIKSNNENSRKWCQRHGLVKPSSRASYEYRSTVAQHCDLGRSLLFLNMVLKVTIRTMWQEWWLFYTYPCIGRISGIIIAGWHEERLFYEVKQGFETSMQVKV